MNTNKPICFNDKNLRARCFTQTDEYIIFSCHTKVSRGLYIPLHTNLDNNLFREIRNEIQKSVKK